jgi:cytochrome c553
LTGLYALVACLAAGAVGTASAQAGKERPTWAYPTLAAMVAGKQPNPEPQGLQQLPGSTVRYALADAESGAKAADWFPEQHAPMPTIVRDGAANGGYACGACHMPTGFGHAESASLVGLTPAYFIKTMLEFRSGVRNDPIRMTGVAKTTSDADIAAAAAWFAALKPHDLPWTKVVESANVPKTFIGPGRMRFVDPDAKGETEPLGLRIIEVPEDPLRMRLHDPAARFIAYVPPGALARGKALAETGGGKTIPCATCHGPNLQGVGDIPPIAGDHPIYLVRQLFDFQDGARAGPDAQLMKPVVGPLSDADIIDLAAYLGSLKR